MPLRLSCLKWQSFPAPTIREHSNVSCQASQKSWAKSFVATLQKGGNGPSVRPDHLNNLQREKMVRPKDMVVIPSPQPKLLLAGIPTRRACPRAPRAPRECRI
ncbi:hypothetical protein CKAH01_05242 [Colletotrichum kahawae]|uniref:Uncharacterized protein n=1 Tax=Colletotrichum kahawae TaxID=34407 RepID=A0AAE0D6P5_COLKA|nr:hypothetical protein CKAH01_05242 [Colletotrichum kahawae]